MAERMKVKVAPDKSGVKIEFLPASGASGELNLTEEQLLYLIQSFGKIHATLVADQPIPELEGQQIEAVFNTRWYIDPGLIGEASILTFQHPGFGPVGFAVPIEQVETMIRLLTIQVEHAKALKATLQ